MTKKPKSEGIPLKKQFGQHFLRDETYIREMLQAVHITHHTSLFEIGCGDGVLTKALLDTPCERLWVFEIDPDWAEFVQKKYNDSRMQLFLEDFLQTDIQKFYPFKPWLLLANIPYQITFPLLKRLQEHSELLQEAVIMIQEDVAQKIIAAPGQSTVQSIFYSYYFEWKLLSKVPPTAFFPAPKVWSRLVYFKPRLQRELIQNIQEFWKFVTLCFRHRRRTIKNNLLSTHYNLNAIDPLVLQQRAQELTLKDFLILWEHLHASNLPPNSDEHMLQEEKSLPEDLNDLEEKK